MRQASSLSGEASACFSWKQAHNRFVCTKQLWACQSPWKTVIFYKPCSVQIVYQVKTTLGNHLSAINLPSCIRLIPSKKRPYHCLGCSLEGFTAFHRHCFQWRFVTVALSRILTHSLSLRMVSCRYRLLGTLAYGFARHEHYQHLSRCEHGLSSDRVNRPAIARKSQCLVKN